MAVGGWEELLAVFSEHWRLGFGLILVLVVLFSPDGLTGLMRRLGLRAPGLRNDGEGRGDD